MNAVLWFLFRGTCSKDVRWITVGNRGWRLSVKVTSLVAAISTDQKLFPSHWSNAFGVLIAAIVILLPAILHAQQGTPEAIAPVPGISWEGPPGEVEWEPVDQRGPTDSGAQDHRIARERHDEAAERRQEQDLMAQQAMAEQAKRMADFMFWQTFFQIVVGVALLIGLGITIYYARQIANGVKLSGQARLKDHRGQPSSIQSQPVAGAHIK